MAYAPTRPPTYSAGRRPPKGLRVPGSIRDRLTTAAALVKATAETESANADRLSEAGDSQAAEAARQRATEAYDSAAAVHAILAPRGYRLLEEKRAGSTTMTLSVTEQLKQALEGARVEFDAVFSGLAEEALQAVRDRGWVPPAPPRVRRGTSRGRAVLNVRVDEALRRDVTLMLPTLSEQSGYDVTLSNIMLTYICDELGVERPNTSGSEVRTRVPKTLMDHFAAEAAARQVSLQELVEDGVRDLLDGSWRPERNAYFTSKKRGAREQVRSWSEKGRAALNVPLDPKLLAGLRSACDEMSEEYGYLVYPGAVVRAILTDRLGEPAE